jgi:hypothetical protein
MQNTTTAQTITRYRVMVTAVVSNDGDVRTYCYAGQSWAGLSEGRANVLVASLTRAIGLGVVHADLGRALPVPDPAPGRRCLTRFGPARSRRAARRGRIRRQPTFPRTP